MESLWGLVIMLIDILLPLSLIFIMFTLGLGLTVLDFKNVLFQPKAFMVGIINQMIILPLIAFLIAIFFSLSGEMAVGMMILACCPGGVTSNIITKFAKGDTALSISYTAIISIVTVITLPLIVGFSRQYFMGADTTLINIFDLGLIMFVITAVPVCIGLYINMRYNDFSKSFSLIANKVSTLLFVIIVIGALISEWVTFKDNLNVLAPSIISLICIMLFISYNSAKLFKISKKKRITIAIESGIQNATVGITIGNLIMPSDVGISTLSLTYGVYGILMYLVCLPFIFLFFKKNNY